MGRALPSVEFWKVKVKFAQLCPTLCDPRDCIGPSPGPNTGVGTLSLLQGIFPTQGSKAGLLHCRWILYQLSHKESSVPTIKIVMCFLFFSC